MAPSSTSDKIGCYVLRTRLLATKTYELWQSEPESASALTGRVLVKRLLPELAENPRLAEQFVLRGQRASRLSHEGIERVVDIVADREDYGLVVEMRDGQTLREIHERLRDCDNALPVWFALHVARRICAALESAHQGQGDSAAMHAVYHQDVSPENVVITSRGQVQLIDFGLSRAALLGTEGTGTRRWSDSGEFDLWAPHFGDAQTDLLGLGRVLYELLAGRPPSRRYVPPSRHAAWVSPEFDQLLARLINAPAAERFTSATQIGAALDEAIGKQRQQVDASHLAALLSVVVSSCPKSEPPPAFAASTGLMRPPPPRTSTILPAALANGYASEPPNSSSVPPSQRSSQHDWDAAVSRVKTESQRPHAPGISTASPSRSATESFERGLEQLKAGDLEGAEASWSHALELDPNYRLCQVNLNLLRKRRDSERPVAM